MNDIRPLIRSVRVLSRAARSPGPSEPSDQACLDEARRQLAAISALELVEVIIKIRMSSPEGGIPELWA